MSSLQRQLAAVAASSTHQLDLRAQKLAHGKSLLFEPRIAASQSFENVYLLCYEGYQELCALDPRFVQFSRSLFSEQSKAEDRTQMTQKENEKLNEVLEAFITMVGPRLLLKPAEKALEWLVRRFRVHEYNTECLVLTYLPYHNSAQFLALLSILPPNPKPALRFLHPYIQSITNPPRRTIVYTAVNTPAFFNALQNHVVRVMEAGHQSSSLLSFWSIVTTEAIAGILNQTSSGQRGVQDQKTEELLLRVLPVLNACMRSGNGAEAVTACYTIVIVLASEASFEDKILDTLMEAAIISYGDETLEPCLKCLAVLAEERSRVQLPRAVSRRLLRVQNLSKTLLSLSKDAKGCRIDRLALGAALGALDNLDASEESQQIFRDIVESNMLDESQLSVALSALVQVLRKSEPASPEHSHLVDFVSRLSDLPAVSRLLEAVAKKTGTNLESLGLILGSTLMDEAMPREDEDEEMPDAIDEDSISTPLVLPPEIREISFLATSFSETFQTTRAALNQAVASHRASQFLAAESLQQKKAFENPLYFSFLARVWCSQDLIATRLTALRSATALIKNNDRPTNLQNVIPSLLYALSDPSATIRQSAVACMAELSAKMEDWQKSYRGAPWGSTDLYGDDSSNISDLFSEHVSGLLSVLVPILEECAMDANVAIATLKEVLEGSQSNKASKHSLKATLRQHITSWLAGHIANTPLISVRLRLLPLVCFVGKSSAAARTDTILPMIRAWCSFPRTEVVSRCDNEQFATNDAERAHLKALVPREAESVSLLMDVISGKCSQDRPQLLDASFDWLVSNWSSMRSESRLGLSLSLLDLSLQDKNPEFDDQCTSRSLQTLRVVKLDSPSLVSLLQSVPSSAEMAEGPPTKKRRRTSRSELARAEFQSPDVARLLRRLTLVLELVEGSIPGNHPTLFKNLFTILGELQQLKQQSGSDLVYLQSLVLGSLTPIVNSIRTEKDTTEYRAAVRADLLVDCIRHSTSPQVQNAALLLISTLASWVPELILHNLMPIFTFIGSNLLRQQDDYSAHVVDQTISRVVPPLAASLRSKHKNFLTGVADLLLSFIAAFEHIPLHRRLKLFSELARTLGPQDSLSAIAALLVDKFPHNKAQHRFVIDLLTVFEPVDTLHAFKGYLDLVEDATGKKGKLSDTLFSLSEKQPSEVEAILQNLLTSLAGFAADDRLRSHVGRAFSKISENSESRTLFASIVETTVRISKKVATQQKLYQSCARVLGKCLDLLPTTDLVKSTELLLANEDYEVKIAAIRSVEVRAGTVTQSKKPSVMALLAFLPSLVDILQHSEEPKVKRVAIGCVDSIIAQFGKKDVATVTTAAQTIAGPKALYSNDSEVRILSLLCLTSTVDVLEDEAISFLPTVLPKAFEYLGMAIEEGNTTLHNAVYALLINIVQRLGFMFSRDYLIPVLKLSHQSATGGLVDACDKERTQFYQVVSQHLEAQEIFTSIKTTWSDAIKQGFGATEEHLALMLSTIESQTKAKLVKSSPTLFALLLELFKLRAAIADSDVEFDEDEIDELEAMIVEAILSMTLKLNDAIFRPFFAQLVDQASTSSLTFYNFLAAFFDKFKSIVTSYSSYIIDNAVALLDSLAKDKSESKLRTALLLALQRSFEHDQDGFWQAPSHFGAIMSSLLAQLTVPNTPSKLSAIVEFAAASSSSTDNHREMNNVLCKYMRAEEASTRLATVLCEQELTKRLGEEWLSLLPEMLPFIAELREDDDELVERETQRWITGMEEILGEDLEAMLQ